MKKVIAILAVALVGMSAAFSAKAIEDPWVKGTKVAGVQIGFLPGIGGSAYFDYVLVDSWWKGHFTVGGEILYRHWSTSYSDYVYSYNDFGFAPRATYGLNITDKFEVHAGTMIGLGLSTWGWSDEHHKESSVGPCIGGIAGLRYFFTDKLALSAELQASGYGQYANVGIAFKF